MYEKKEGRRAEGGEKMSSEGFYLVVVEFTNKQKLDRSLNDLEFSKLLNARASSR